MTRKDPRTIKVLVGSEGVFAQLEALGRALQFHIFLWFDHEIVAVVKDIVLRVLQFEAFGLFHRIGPDDFEDPRADKINPGHLALLKRTGPSRKNVPKSGEVVLSSLT